MPFKGELKKQQQITIDVIGAATGKGAITVIKINRREKVSHADPSTIDLGVAQTLTENLGLGIDRLMIYINPPPGGSMDVTVRQSGVSFNDVCPGDSVLVWDVVA